MSDEHCKDCCCARCWKALGITEYTSLSIPEHIDALRAENARFRAALEDITTTVKGTAVLTYQEMDRIAKQALESDTVMSLPSSELAVGAGKLTRNRIINILKNNNIKTIGEFIRFNKKTLRMTPNFGNKSYSLMIENLNRIGINFEYKRLY